MTIKELIKKLEKYNLDTEICSGYINKNSMSHYDLIIKESNPIGDRDSEEELLLWLGFEDNKLHNTPFKKEMIEALEVFRFDNEV